jgi:hypothetical protein
MSTAMAITWSGENGVGVVKCGWMLVVVVRGSKDGTEGELGNWEAQAGTQLQAVVA